MLNRYSAYKTAGYGPASSCYQRRFAPRRPLRTSAIVLLNSITYGDVVLSHRWRIAWAGVDYAFEGMPAGVPVDVELINGELRRRQGGYGRGGRQKIETDQVEFLSGVRLNKTIASPIAMMIPNKDSRLDDLAAPPPASAEARACGFGGLGEMADDRLPRDAGTRKCARNGGARRGGGAGAMFSQRVWD